jgi:hypothetical protein
VLLFQWSSVNSLGGIGVWKVGGFFLWSTLYIGLPQKKLNHF